MKRVDTDSQLAAKPTTPPKSGGPAEELQPQLQTQRQPQPSNGSVDKSQSADDNVSYLDRTDDEQPVKRVDTDSQPAAKPTSPPKSGGPAEELQPQLQMQRQSHPSNGSIDKSQYADDNVSYLDPTNGKRYKPVELEKGVPGQCLFVAMADQLEHLGIGRTGYPEDYYKTLRRKAVETQCNMDHIKGVSRSERSLKNMLQPKTYGNHAEVCALSVFCKVIIRICQVDSDGNFQWSTVGNKFDQIPKVGIDGKTSFVDVPRPQDNRPTVRLLLFFKSPNSPLNHYTSLREIKQLQPQPAQPSNSVIDNSQPRPQPVLFIDTNSQSASKPTPAHKSDGTPDVSQQEPQTQLQPQPPPEKQPQPNNSSAGESQPLPRTQPQPRLQAGKAAALPTSKPATSSKSNKPAPTTPARCLTFGSLGADEHRRLLALVNRINARRFRKNIANDLGMKDATAECNRKEKNVRPLFFPRYTPNTQSHVYLHSNDLTQTPTHKDTLEWHTQPHPSHTHALMTHTREFRNINILPRVQEIWECVEAKFKAICPPQLNEMLSKFDVGRFSVNQIENGLEWHWDHNDPEEDDVRITVPGMTFVIHLGSNRHDAVDLRIHAMKNQKMSLKPMMIYAFPGYAFKHRTKRSRGKKREKRYSISIFRTFRIECRQLADAFVHTWYPKADDNYKGRTKKIQKNCDEYIKRNQDDGITRALIRKSQSAPDPTRVQPYRHREPLVEVAKSTVHGNGLFAKRNIPKGSVICWYSGTCTPSNDFDHDNSSDWILEVEWVNQKTHKQERWFLDSLATCNSAGRWANDPCNTEYQSNAEYARGPLSQHPEAKDKYYVFLTATRHVWKGEEILINYGSKYWS